MKLLKTKLNLNSAYEVLCQMLVLIFNYNWTITSFNSLNKKEVTISPPIRDD